MKRSTAVALIISALLLTASCAQNSDIANTLPATSEASASQQFSSQVASNTAIPSSTTIQETVPSESTTVTSTATSATASAATKSTTKSTTTATTTKSTTAATEKPLVFDDPVLESLLRSCAKKATGSVFPSDFSQLYNQNLYIRYQYAENLSVITAGSEDGINLHATGRIASFKVFSTIPFRQITLAYGIPPDSLSTTYTFDMQYFTRPGALEAFSIFGNHESEIEDNHIQSIILKNFCSIAQCPNLSYLTLYDCQGVILDSTLNLSKMQGILVQDCSISSIAALRNATKLKTLIIDYNPIADLSPVAGNSSLSTVKLSNLASVDTATLLSLPNLSQLILSYCPLISRSDFDQLRLQGANITIYTDGRSFKNTYPY